MPRYAIQILRREWYATDYGGMVEAENAVAALSAANRSPYFREVSKIKPKSVIAIKALLLPADELQK